MTYFKARDCFEDNRNHLNPQQNPALWNLSEGLVALSHALENDLRQIQQALRKIAQALEQSR